MRPHPTTGGGDRNPSLSGGPRAPSQPLGCIPSAGKSPPMLRPGSGEVKENPLVGGTGIKHRRVSRTTWGNRVSAQPGPAQMGPFGAVQTVGKRDRMGERSDKPPTSEGNARRSYRMRPDLAY